MIRRTLLSPLCGLLLLACATALIAAERDAVILVDGCTGFIVEGNLLVTAKHCRHPERISVTIGTTTVPARRVYVTPGDDGPVVFQLNGGPYESLPVAERMPPIGEPIYSLGYPSGHWARIEGKITGGNGVDLNYTNHRIAPGNSGGPLLNSRGEVIGVALYVAADVREQWSGFAGWQVTTGAIRAARSLAGETPQKFSRRPLVVVFSTESCSSCLQLDRDVTAGHFPGYEFQFVHWNSQNSQWTDRALYGAFWAACNPDKASLGFPTIWVQGTDQYRVGYETARRGGLLGWLSSAVQHLLDGIVGREPEPQFPTPAPIPDPGPTPLPDAEPFPPPSDPVSQLAADLAALRDQARDTKADLDAFKEAGVIGKIKAIARLKSDKDDALAKVEAVKTDVADLRTKFHEEPLQFLWGLFGVLSGLVHRRFAA